MKRLCKKLSFSLMLLALLALTGCDIAVLNPVGLIAIRESKIIVFSTLFMLCIVVPVMILIIAFAIKYRAGNKGAEYLPDWHHSTKMETVIWGIPIVVVAILAIPLTYGAFVWEPSKPILSDDSKAYGQYSPANYNPSQSFEPADYYGGERPIQVDVVALDWKWLFIYPEYGVASVNELYAPAGRQVFLQLTAEDSINAFWVPTLGTVLYAMPQMNAKLHLYTDVQGEFPGVSANYSGDGFAGMRFTWHSVDKQGFEDWIAKLRASGNSLNKESYLQLAKKSKNNDVEYFSETDKDLYYQIVNRCVVDGTICNEDLMRQAAAKTLWGQICSVFDPDQLVVN